MAKLKDLFESREEDLYTQPNDLPEGTIRLTDAEPMSPAYEDQSNPISVSAQRDVKRMVRFSTSGKGLVFLAKQQVLQSANTFAETRLYNPANITIHAVPFVHEKRHLDLRGGIIRSILEEVGVSFSDSRSYTTLQQETVQDIELSNPYSPARRNMESLGGILAGTPKPAAGLSAQQSLIRLGTNLIDQITSPFTNTISGINAQLRGGQGRSRPEIVDERSDYYTKVADSFNQNTDQIPFSNKPTPLSVGDSPADGEDQGKSYIQSLRSWKKFGATGWDKRISIGVPRDGGTTDGEKFVGPDDNSPGLTRYYKDLTQIEHPGLPIIGEDREFVSALDSDSVDILFRVRNRENGKTERIRFRAFLSGLQENVSPSYNENKYVGRYETFYMYNKVIRDIQFGLTLHAFSEEESQAIMQKMSYLSSLAYPISSDNYLTPLVFNVTIGKLYVDQPSLMMSVNHTIEDDTSWDIDRQLPMTINSQVGLRLLDKELYTYQSLRDKETPFTSTKLSEAKYMPTSTAGEE